MLQRVKDGINILGKMKIRKGNWICLILRRNRFLKDVFEERVDKKGTGGRRYKQLLDDLTEIRQY